MMALIDEIERLGRAVDEGSLPHDEAVAALVEASEGGLTEAGASDLVDHWSVARSQYTDLVQRARSGLTDALNDLYWRSPGPDHAAPHPEL